MDSVSKNIVVGGTGFIGSVLVAELVRRGESVTSISRHDSDEQVNGAEYVFLDIESDIEDFQQALGLGNTIFLLTGQVYSGFDAENEERVFTGLLNVLGKADPKKVLFASSALAYGECDRPAAESSEPLPKDAYSVFKLKCEKMILERNFTFPVGILRFANVYGSEKNRGFIGLAFKKALDGTLLMVNGDGLQLRDYIFVDDVVSGALSVRDRLTQTDIVNIATGKSSTLLDVIQMVSAVTQKDIDFKVVGDSVVDTEKSVIDNTKLRDAYHFLLFQSLSDGLSKTWKRYVDSLKY